jgi:hypothetical protein
MVVGVWLLSKRRAVDGGDGVLHIHVWRKNVSRPAPAEAMNNATAQQTKQLDLRLRTVSILKRNCRKTSVYKASQKVLQAIGRSALHQNGADHRGETPRGGAPPRRWRWKGIVKNKGWSGFRALQGFKLGLFRVGEGTGGIVIAFQGRLSSQRWVLVITPPHPGEKHLLCMTTCYLSSIGTQSIIVVFANFRHAVATDWSFFVSCSVD